MADKVTMLMTYEGQEYGLDVTTLAVMTQWEEHFDRSFGSFSDDPRITYIAYASWCAAKIQGVKVPAKFSEFCLANPTFINPDNGEGAETNPTTGAQ